MKYIILASLALVGIFAHFASPAVSGDRMVLPPLVREACSEDGILCTRLTHNGSQSTDLFPSLIIYTLKDTEFLANIKLRMPIGPRYLFVTNTRKIVLFDEWLRRGSETPFAISVYSDSGLELATFSQRQVRELAGLTEKEVADNAVTSFGTWLSGEPYPDVNQGQFHFSIGNIDMLIDAKVEPPTVRKFR